MLPLLASLVFRCVSSSPLAQHQDNTLKLLPSKLKDNLLITDSAPLTLDQTLYSPLLLSLAESDKQAITLLLAKLVKRQTCAIKKEDYDK